MVVPYVLPFDITLVLLVKTWRLLPYIRKELKTSLHSLLSYTTKMVNKMQSKKSQCSAKFSCELAITEFDYFSESNQMKLVNATSSPSSTAKKSGLALSKSEIIKEATLSSLKHTHIQNLIKKEKIQRKSYAGREFSATGYHTLPTIRVKDKERRKSMADLHNCIPSERVIQKMNFDFTFDLPSNESESRPGSSSKNINKRTNDVKINEYADEADKMLLALKTLGSDVTSENIDLDAVEITNKALSLEKVYFENCSKHGLGKATENADTIEKIMEVTTNHDAVMAFYYLDENKRVKVSEIYNMTNEKPRDNMPSKMFSFNCTEDGIVGSNDYNADKEDGLAFFNSRQSE